MTRSPAGGRAETAVLDERIAATEALLADLRRQQLLLQREATGARSPDVRYVQIPKAAELTGYTVKAIRGKIAQGIWRDGIECRKAPDGHRMIDLRGYERWVEAGR